MAKFPELVFSGVQPTGNLHLGNYLGALKRFVEMQATHDCLYCVVDLHAMTMMHDPAQLRQATRDVTMAFIACGLDPRRSIIFNQSRVAEHAELAWVFDCVARLGVFEGEFHWHHHDREDEFFFVLEGKLLLNLEGRTVELGPRQGMGEVGPEHQGGDQGTRGRGDGRSDRRPGEAAGDDGGDAARADDEGATGHVDPAGEIDAVQALEAGLEGVDDHLEDDLDREDDDRDPE